MNRTILSICLALILAPVVNAQVCDSCVATADLKPKAEQRTIQLANAQPGIESAIPLRRFEKTPTPASQEAPDPAAQSPIPIPSPTEATPQENAIPNKLAAELDEAIANFKERYPKTKVIGFSLTPIRGLYEADVAKEVVYFDKSARFLITGRLLDIEKGIDLTDAKLKEIRRVDIDKLPLDLAIKQVKGDGKRQLVLFTDVDCPFSRKLSSTLEGVDNVTIWTFLFPLTSIHPEAKDKSDAVWCNKDSLSALQTVMKGEHLPSLAISPLCESPVEEIIKLGADLGIGGTPTIINGKGDRSAGAMPLDKLEAFIDAGMTKDDK